MPGEGICYEICFARFVENLSVVLVYIGFPPLNLSVRVLVSRTESFVVYLGPIQRLAIPFHLWHNFAQPVSGYRISYSCDRTAPMPLADASVVRLKGFWKSGYLSMTSSDVRMLRSLRNALR